MRVVLLGANGMFGKRLAVLLAGIPGLQLVLAGRGVQALIALADRLATVATTTVDVRRIDLDSEACTAQLLDAAPAVLIDTCGPFQGRDYRFPNLAIQRRFHYVDLADAPDFVAGITQFDAAARAANVLIASGASTVPALSSAVIDAFAAEFATLAKIDIGVAPTAKPGAAISAVIACAATFSRTLPTMMRWPIFKGQRAGTDRILRGRRRGWARAG